MAFLAPFRAPFQNPFPKDGAATPRIDSFTPSSREVGQTVTVSGNNFTGTTGVTINGVSASFVEDSNTQLTVTVPTSATTGKIAVTTAIGIAESATNLTVSNFVLTATTTAPSQTVTLQRITPTGSAIKVYWGDGSNSTIASGNTVTTNHVYTSAAAYTVRIEQPRWITYLDLRDAKLSGTINQTTNNMPTGLTTLYLQSLSGLTWTVNGDMPTGLTTLSLQSLSGLTWTVSGDMPTGLTYLSLNNLTGLTWTVGGDMPTGLTTLYLNTLSGLTWTINGTNSWPTGATTATVLTCVNVTVSAWTDNAIRIVRFENAWSQANVDACVNAFWANKANFTYATPSLDILGGSNAAPSGTYQAASPPTTGKEKIYDLVNGNYTPAGPEWTVQYQA